MPKARIIVADVFDGLRSLPDESVQCCITSPPYWGLRDYGAEGQIGLEKTPEEYTEKMVAVFREVRRVLRDDGVLWLNLGDSYASSGPSDPTGLRRLRETEGGRFHDGQKAARAGLGRAPTPPGLKPKDLVGIPWRVAFALQTDGWYLRSDIIWAKPNPMPESVTDRPTKAHEYVFLLTKSAKYFWDQEAVKEQLVPGTHPPGNKREYDSGRPDGMKMRPNRGAEYIAQNGRNIRTVWTIPTQPFPEAHFATFPPKLVEPMVKAGTSEKGCRPECGKAWGREAEKEYKGSAGVDYKDVGASRGQRSHRGGGDWAKWKAEHPDKDLGFRPFCSCEKDPVPCSVLDPFAGAGTTGLVALMLGRDFIGIEINPEYAEMAARRIRTQAPLFNEVEIEK